MPARTAPRARSSGSRRRRPAPQPLIATPTICGENRTNRLRDFGLVAARRIWRVPRPQRLAHGSLHRAHRHRTRSFLADLTRSAPDQALITSRA